ncbi:hypothetical protein [Aquimarina sp. I32.4]|uniref:hypothetical protein n=1 Tax=Aquimarina sp. I32.4 TaxID=2053903 RepID=UPI000CDE6B17|nr:hypothetical protein [Aquimarina sp. I32.4]
MRGQRKYRKTIVYFLSKYQPEQVWEFLIHPKYIEEFTKDPCFYNKIESDFKIEKGAYWVEVHTGEDCSGDIVKCQIVQLDINKRLRTVRYQAGIKNSSTYELNKLDQGTLISEEQKFSISFRDFKGINIVSWIMMITGLLTRFSYKPDEDLYWFEKMENAISQNINKV